MIIPKLRPVTSLYNSLALEIDQLYTKEQTRIATCLLLVTYLECFDGSGCLIKPSDFERIKCCCSLLIARRAVLEYHEGFSVYAWSIEAKACNRVIVA